MKRLVGYFLQGLIFLVPIALSLWVVLGIFGTLDDWSREKLGLKFPGAGLVATLVTVTVVGYLSSHLFTRRITGWLERAIGRVPVVKLVYGSVKDLMSAFVGPERKFDRPVVVDLQADGWVRALGFVTRDALEGYGLPESVAVYFPQAYNFAGQVVLVPRQAVRELALPASDVMTFIVSGGISGK